MKHWCMERIPPRVTCKYFEAHKHIRCLLVIYMYTTRVDLVVLYGVNRKSNVLAAILSITYMQTSAKKNCLSARLFSRRLPVVQASFCFSLKAAKNKQTNKQKKRTKTKRRTEVIDRTVHVLLSNYFVFKIKANTELVNANLNTRDQVWRHQFVISRYVLFLCTGGVMVFSFTRFSQ